MKSKRAVGWTIASIILLICAALALQTLTLQMGMHLYRTGEHGRALPWLRAAMVLNPFTPSIRNAAATILVKEGRLEDAQIVLLANLRSHPGDAKSNNLIGMVYEGRGDTQKALGHYAKAAALDPTYAEALFNMGYLLYKTGNYEEARKTLDKAVEIAPELARQREEILDKIPLEPYIEFRPE